MRPLAIRKISVPVANKVTIMQKKVGLTALSRELTILTGKPAPGYRQLWAAIADGQLPAERPNGRYLVDVNEAAKALGLISDQAA